MEKYMFSSRSGKTAVTLDPETLQITINADGMVWQTLDSYKPHMIDREGNEIFFADASEVTHKVVETGLGRGIRSAFAGLPGVPLFETYIWVEDSGEDVYFEWIPFEEEACETGFGPETIADGKMRTRANSVNAVCWPGAFDFEQPEKKWYTVLPCGQGMIIPNDWKTASRKLPFDGMFLTSGSYMPWFGQVRDGEGYIAIATTPWNGRVQFDHPEHGPYGHVWVQWELSLGKMDYRRILRYSFRRDASYNELCKIYREYVFENGLACTLKEKEQRIPSLRKLVGAEWVHTGIKTHVDPESRFFDPENPEKNNHLKTFASRKEMLQKIHEAGVENVYLHLDGWADPGYDNMHPDYLPACIEAGGWEGLKDLVDSVHEMGYQIGLHDQYRDFYRHAPSFDEDYAVLAADGSMLQHANWAGGPQTYLSTTEALGYVKRNYKEVFSHGIHPDCTYLDVFTCNEGDECANPRHRMTRRESYELRGKCFDWMITQGICTSSEEVSDWSMRSLIFCHYAPFSFQLEAPGTEQMGVPTPLFELVYHDCVIVPWIMDKNEGQPDNMLYALLNGGAPYLIREGAYANTDGSYEGGEAFSLEELKQRSDVVARLHKKVAFETMVKHEFIGGNYDKQGVQFSDGSQVIANLKTDHYEISLAEENGRKIIMNF